MQGRGRPPGPGSAWPAPFSEPGRAAATGVTTTGAVTAVAEPACPALDPEAAGASLAGAGLRPGAPKRAARRQSAPPRAHDGLRPAPTGARNPQAAPHCRPRSCRSRRAAALCCARRSRTIVAICVTSSSTWTCSAGVSGARTQRAGRLDRITRLDRQRWRRRSVRLRRWGRGGQGGSCGLEAGPRSGQNPCGSVVRRLAGGERRRGHGRQGSCSVGSPDDAARAPGVAGIDAGLAPGSLGT